MAGKNQKKIKAPGQVTAHAKMAVDELLRGGVRSFSETAISTVAQRHGISVAEVKNRLRERGLIK